MAAGTPRRDSSSSYDSGVLDEGEQFWARQYEWLESKGYRLRPRYAPGWVPSWRSSGKRSSEAEDALVGLATTILDATRISDNAFVTLKQINKKRHPYEVDITTSLVSSDTASEGRSHGVPVFDVLDVPGDTSETILVMPLLRPFDDPAFETFGEVVEFISQMIESVQFMHKHSVAHRDIHRNNILFDAKPLYPKPWHPISLDKTRDFKAIAKHFTRTERPVVYYFIDWGLARRYSTDEPRLEKIDIGGDTSPPEFQEYIRIRNEAYQKGEVMPQDYSPQYDPFPTDVYYVGSLIKDEFMDVGRGFEFMKPLVDRMMAEDPAKRPQMDEVVEMFADIKASISSWKLRSRVVLGHEDPVGKWSRVLDHAYMRLKFILLRKPAIPTPY